MATFKHIKTPEKSVRRLLQIDEIIRVKEGIQGEVESNALFQWNPVKDAIELKKESVIIDKISANTGITKEKLKAEWKTRTQILQKMKEKNIIDFKEVNDLINEYYKEPKKVLKMFGIS